MKKILKSFGLSTFIISILLIILLLIAIFIQIIRMKNLPKSKPLDKIIIFTEIGCKILEIEKRKPIFLNMMDLFNDDTIKILKDNKYQISIAMDNLNNDYIDVINLLNKNNIKVWIWPLLSIEEGYWLSTDNAGKFVKIYNNLKKWIRENNLDIYGIMLDMEPNYQDAQRMKKIGEKEGTNGIIKFLLKRIDKKLYKKSQDIYRNIILTIKDDGYMTSTFNYPYILDDKFDKDNSIQQMFHINYIKSDISIFMLYRSFFKDSGLGTKNANVISYALSLKGASAGIGSYMEDYLTFSDFENDLRIASRLSPILHIYNLESLVSKNWLKKISDVDLSKQVKVPILDSFFIIGYRTFFNFLDILFGTSRYIIILIIIFVWILLSYFLYLFYFNSR